ncbi:hypothetical protein E0F15_07220 [Frankia sp. B2]|uniref:hypothetical protein n=1 Tax=Frankia TaxID=1854 RepID=UPI00059EC06E|nr:MULTISPECIES: hypothetical protein [Frankia]OHV56288.1 hypothetical protein CgIS1_09230 [Frankia sp. CgIS1]TFE32867.1 hypothetical protein E0F15_07220 [Frankia sp. B2]
MLTASLATAGVGQRITVDVATTRVGNILDATLAIDGKQAAAVRLDVAASAEEGLLDKWITLHTDVRTPLSDWAPVHAGLRRIQTAPPFPAAAWTVLVSTSPDRQIWTLRGLRIVLREGDAADFAMHEAEKAVEADRRDGTDLHDRAHYRVEIFDRDASGLLVVAVHDHAPLAVAGVPAAAAGLDVEDLPYLPDDPEHAATGTQGAAPALAGPAEPVRYALSRSATTAPLVLTENDVEIARVRIDPGRASTENRQMLRDWVSLHTGQPAPPVDWLQLRRGRWEFDAPAPAAGPTAGPRGQLLVSADGGQSWVLYGVGTPRADADPHRVAESVVAHEIARLRGQVGDDAALLVRCEMYSPDRQIVAVDSRDLRGDVNATAAGTVPAEGQDPPRYRGELYGPDRALRRTYEHPAEPRPAPARPPAVAGLLGAAFPPTRAGVTPASPPSPSDSAASTIPASPTIPGRPPHTGR